MIEQDRDLGTYDVSCDFCTETIEIDDRGGWQAMIQKIKALGWWMKKVDEVWKHKCPACVQEKKYWD